AGALGGFVIQLAVHRGLRVAAEATAQDERLLKQLGAEILVPREVQPGNGESADLADRYRRAVPEGVDAVVDAAVVGDPILGAVRDGGQIVTCRPGRLALERGITQHEANVLAYPGKTDALAELAALAAEGTLTVRTASVLPPERVCEAHWRLAGGGVRGRQLIAFGDREWESPSL
ncbi:zinc-binding dehydrogenase, partial [Streptomyces daliensis]|nr:zinc-binding dehydrogenase [Streptomyces daliensis]